MLVAVSAIIATFPQIFTRAYPEIAYFPPPLPQPPTTTPKKQPNFHKTSINLCDLPPLFEKSLAKTFGYQALFSYIALLVEICRNYSDLPCQIHYKHIKRSKPKPAPFVYV